MRKKFTKMLHKKSISTKKVLSFRKEIEKKEIELELK